MFKFSFQKVSKDMHQNDQSISFVEDEELNGTKNS